MANFLGVSFWGYLKESQNLHEPFLGWDGCSGQLTQRRMARGGVHDRGKGADIKSLKFTSTLMKIEWEETGIDRYKLNNWITEDICSFPDSARYIS